MIKAYKYRLYLNQEQKIFIDKIFGVNRYVWNNALAYKKVLYTSYNINISLNDIDKEIRIIKKSEEYQWIAEVPEITIGWTLRNLDSAFKNFFRRVKKGDNPGYPKFKSKHKHQSFQFHRSYKLDFDNGLIRIPKLKSWIKFIVDRKPIGIPKICTISKTKTGKYFLSIQVEENSVAPHKKEIIPDSTLGIDLNTKNIVFSDGRIKEIPKHEKEFQRIKILQKRASKKCKNSANQKKVYLKIAKQYEKIRNRKAYWLHHITTQLIRESQTNTFAVEKLKVANMVKSSKGDINCPGKNIPAKSALNRVILNANFHEFISILSYKAEWYGKNIIQCKVFDSTSKSCHNCGYKNDDLKLSNREWQCTNCKVIHDRDINAAINIKYFALKNSGVFSSSVPVEL